MQLHASRASLRFASHIAKSCTYLQCTVSYFSVLFHVRMCAVGVWAVQHAFGIYMYGLIVAFNS